MILRGVLLGAAISSAAVLGAQVRPPLPPTRPPARDSATTPDTSVKWAPPDSVMNALLKKPGYTVTRYQGGVVTFNALDKALAIGAATAKQAIVERDGQRVLTDSVIVYDNQTRIITVSGTFEIAPGGGQAPIAGSSTARYDLSQRSGRISNARVTVDESGQRWFIQSEIGKTALGDSTRGIPPRFYGLGGSLTSCDDSIPDYHFELREIKRTEKTLVARPAVLYIRDIPVMWLPFVFQDIRPGRRSGILPPRFGASDIVRNNPGYRRHIENLGYYWALSDYMDVAAWINWRSSAGADSTDPGWTELNGEWKYNWLNRYLSGRLAGTYMRERDGDTRYNVSWDHNENFGRNRSVHANVNYTSNTTLQRRNTFNPYAAIATIASAATYNDRLGPVSLVLGGTRTQYPGRSQIQQTLPTLSLSSPTINLASWLTWTPSFRYTEQATLHIDLPGPLSSTFAPGTHGRLVDTTALDRNAFDRSVEFQTPIRVFGMDFQNGIRIHDLYRDYPESKIVYVGADSGRKEERVFGRTFRTDVDWNPMFSLPPFFQNRFRLTPSISLGNVDPGPFWVRTEASNGKFVHQSKRLTYGLSAAPTIFGIFPGFGPFQRFRHSISPTISYGFAPRAKVDTEYLAANGRFKQGYLGALPQSFVTLGLSQNVEAKIRAPRDTGAGEAQKLTVLSMQFTPLSYDFERARATGKRLAGLTSENFGTTLRSELLPGFDVGVDYSLFQGSTLSDTALFKPFLTRVSSTIHLSKGENPLTVISRFLGKAVPDQSSSSDVSSSASEQDQRLARQGGSLPVAGQASRSTQFVPTPTKGWDASFQFTTTRSRPPTGNRVLQIDPHARCEVYRLVDSFTYQRCLSEPVNANDALIPSTTAGSIAIQLPRQTSLASTLNFELTQKWSAQWRTSYDFERRQFASQDVSLQRDLHDWRAVFNFTHSPNGNFAFNFFIALKPQPDLKFDYSRATSRS